MSQCGRKITDEEMEALIKLREVKAANKRAADPEEDCEAFELEARLSTFRDCMGDGHYMCRHCARFDMEGRRANGDEL